MSENTVLNDPGLTTPGVGKGIFDVFRYRYLLTLLVKKGIATRYYGSTLGWIWSYIRPAAQFLMYFLVIGVIFKTNRSVDAFPIYLFSGIVAINLFSEALRNTTSSIVDNKSLVQKIYLPRELFPVAALGVALVHFLPQAAVLFIVVLFMGWTITFAHVLGFFLGIFLVLTFALGLGLFFGAINVAYRDARNFVDIILMFATWASPVLYTWVMVYERAPGWLFKLYMSNPITVAVELFHDGFWFPLSPDSPRPEGLWIFIAVAVVISIGTLIVGQIIFRRLEKTFAQSL